MRGAEPVLYGLSNIRWKMLPARAGLSVRLCARLQQLDVSACPKLNLLSTLIIFPRIYSPLGAPETR